MRRPEIEFHENIRLESKFLARLLGIIAAVLFLLVVFVAGRASAQEIVANPQPAQTTGGTVLIALYGILTLVIAGLGGLLARVLAQRAQANKVWSAVNLLWLKAQATVAHVEATIRPKLQLALKDGKLSKEEVALVQSAALAAFKEKIGSDLLSVTSLLGLSGGAVDGFLIGLLQKAHINLATPAAPSTMPAPNAPVLVQAKPVP